VIIYFILRLLLLTNIQVYLIKLRMFDRLIYCTILQIVIYFLTTFISYYSEFITFYILLKF